ncbi:MAG: aminopeptidase [Bacteroidetes bacterium 4484_276]|nr:MAG: aminopeptidase [Bacteroidetes bacterium 4484_276]
MNYLKIIFGTIAILGICLSGFSQKNTNGAITPGLLVEIKKSLVIDTDTRALINAISNNDIQKLAVNRENEGKIDKYFSNRIKVKGITDQNSSGRCWLYTGLNVIRIPVIEKYQMEGFQLSQTYPFFWDQLEKANLFLEGIIQTIDQPLDNKRVEWLLKNPINDGGQWTGVVDVVDKYGLVPFEIMPDTKNSESTRWMSRLLRRKLREQAMDLRQMNVDGANKKGLEKKKVGMLSEIYRILVLSLGDPPTNFDWRYKKTDGSLSGLKAYTPMSFYREFVNVDLNDYVMFMNDPSRPYNKLYEIDYDRHIFEGGNWKYINLPADEIKRFAIESIKNNEAMYFSCDVGKQLDKKEGTLDINNYDYADLFGVKFDMDKTERIQTRESGSSHGMNLVGVDLDENDKPGKWLLENSWGAKSGFEGFLIMTDDWFDEYMFRLVVHKKFVSPDALKILDTEPVLLPPWDPMFMPEE